MGGTGEEDEKSVVIPKVVDNEFIPNNPFTPKRPYVPNPARPYTPRPGGYQGQARPPPPSTQFTVDNNSGKTAEVFMGTQQNRPPLFEMKYYQEQPPPTRPPAINYVIQGNRNLEYLGLPTGAINMTENIVLPVQKVYKIYTPGPTGGHTTMTHIYEDMIPNKDPKLIYSTLGERLVFYEYLKRSVMRFYEGENIGIGGGNKSTYYDLCRNTTRYTKGERSILEFIKILNIDPKKYSLVEKIPYLILPKNLLIYNTCYPIVFDQVSGTAICAKQSIGIQIRIYALNQAEYASYTVRDELYKKYDVWRELLFYEKIREDLLKTKRCPHFCMKFAHFISANEDIDFVKLRSRPDNERDRLTKEYQTFLFREGVLLKATDPKNDPAYVAKPKYNWIDYFELPDELDPRLQKYSGQCLVLLTEAPTYNIYLWSSRQSIQKGIAEKMTNHGVRRDFEWSNVLFQVAMALSVMQKERIYIADMTLEDNVYIKDLHLEGSNMGYWRYVLDSKSYYLPNIGFLAMIDSNFKDKNKEGLLSETTPRTFKMAIGDLFEKVNFQVLDDKIYANFKNIFNPNNFSTQYLSNNVNRPPEEIMTLLQNIHQDTEKDISKLISSHFTMFLHDRIGTNLTDREVANIKQVNDVFKNGELVVQVISSEVNMWVMIDSIDLTNQTARIFNRVTNSTTGVISPEYSVVPMNSLRQYPSLLTIDHIFKADNKIVEADLLETYII